MVISIFGKSGSGKTTIATHLAKSLSEEGFFTGIISAEIRYGDLQRRLGSSVTESKSLLSAIIDYENAEKYFSKITENLYILSVPDSSTIREYEEIVKLLGTQDNQTKEQISRIHHFVEAVSDIFDFLLIDCTDRINDTITFSFISKSDKVINVIESSVSGITYHNAHKYLNEFDFYQEKMNVLNKHYEKSINRSTIEALILEKIDETIPYRDSTVLSTIEANVDEKLLKKEIKKIRDKLEGKQTQEKKITLFRFKRKDAK